MDGRALASLFAKSAKAKAKVKANSAKASVTLFHLNIALTPSKIQINTSKLLLHQDMPSHLLDVRRVHELNIDMSGTLLV